MNAGRFKRKPVEETASQRVQVTATKAWLEMLDAYREEQAQVPSRNELIRKAVEEWIAAKRKAEP